MLEMGYIAGARLPVTWPIAMQKVVGSNPISRFFAKVRQAKRKSHAYALKI